MAAIYVLEVVPISRRVPGGLEEHVACIRWEKGDQQ